MSRHMIATLVSGVAALLAGAADPPALVRAKVVSVKTEAEGKVGTAVIEILHVYSGKADLKGKKFNDTFRLVADFSGRSAHSEFMVDEEGLWSLRNGGAKGGLVPVWDPSLPFYLRSRDEKRYHHTDNVKLAETIESVCSAKESERVNKLVGLAGSESPIAARWAVLTLGASNEAEAGRYLDALSEKPDPKMPLLAQVAMDEVLSKAKREDWFRAKTRLPMLKGWVTSKADEGGAYLILNRIDHADDGQELRNDVACELVHLAIGNKDWPMPARKYAVTTLGKLGEKVVDDSPAFEGLLDVVKTSKEKELRDAAADSIVKYIRLDDKRRTALSEAQAKEK